MTMPPPSSPPTVAIGVCLNCNCVFPVHEVQLVCPLCGRAPAVKGYLQGAAGVIQEGGGPEVEAGLPAAPPTLISVKCPHCDRDVTLSISDTEISVVSLPPPGPVEEAAAAPPQDPAAAPSPVETAAPAWEEGQL